MIIDGRTLAAQRTEELRRERAQFGPLTLSIVAMQEDAVTSSFLRIKSRVATALDVAVTFAPTLEEATGDGVILQLPLPSGIDVDAARNRIPLMKDVDGLSDAAYSAFVAQTFPPPPVPRALAYMLDAHQVPVQGANVVVVGQGRLVGKPAAELMRQRGARVTELRKGDDLRAHVSAADILILGAGSPGLITRDMISSNVVILDAGTSESGGVVVGDADPACVEKARLCTPVPGGVGPLAVVEIFANLFELVKRR